MSIGMKKLLERWAASKDTMTDPKTGLTRSRCQHLDQDGFAVIHSSATCAWRVNPDYQMDYHYIQAAVQEAIATRKDWYWQLESHNDVTGYSSSYAAHVWSPAVDEEDYEHRDTPAEALLAMYLKVLEVTL